jgi:hypothetical protein
MVVVVAPVPVFLLLVAVKLAVIPMRIAVRFHYPLLVVHVLVTVPIVIVVVIGIVRPVIVVLGTAGDKHCHPKSDSKNHRLKILFFPQGLLLDVHKQFQLGCCSSS